jgi:DNA polymerase
MERARGITFAPEHIGWIDFESRSQVPIDAGAYRYSLTASASVLALAIGDDQVRTCAVADLSQRLDWRDMPDDLKKHYAKVQRGTAIFVAHNSGFDRCIWNNSTIGFPRLEPEHIICSRVQATNAGLPAALDLAAKFANVGRKLPSGKALLKLFMFPGAVGEIATHPDEWQQLLDYARVDVEVMRDLFQNTRQLPIEEWRQFWAGERINDRGVGVDVTLATAAARIAAIDKLRTGSELANLTNDKVTTVNQTKRMLEWLRLVLPSDGRDILTKRAEEVDLDTGELIKPRKQSLERARIVRLLAYLHAQSPLSGPLRDAERLLQIRFFGGSKTPAKFSRILDQHVDGVLRGQYVFGGASQTGRYSSKGVQTHNLARDPLPYELEAINALLAGADYDEFAAIGDDTPVARKLSLLIRPTLVAADGNAFAWCDWANIEARLLPWLSNDPKAEYRLDNFRAVDADPSIPDIYKVTAARMLGIDEPAKVTKPQRQVGKVIELAAGFGGSVGSMLAMAASYGIHATEAEAKEAISRWRKDNRWAVNFWGKHDESGSFGIWGAVNQALLYPGKPFPAGRVTYIYARNMHGGTLFCRLPSGRYLAYRKIHWERVNEIDEDTGKIIAIRRELRFSRDVGRVKAWYGLMTENIVQATAADILRGTLVRLEEAGLAPRVHTHDEVLIETSENQIEAAGERLRAIMEQGFEWSAGLPIKADVEIGRWYSKAEESVGL